MSFSRRDALCSPLWRPSTWFQLPWQPLPKCVSQSFFGFVWTLLYMHAWRPFELSSLKRVGNESAPLPDWQDPWAGGDNLTDLTGFEKQHSLLSSRKSTPVTLCAHHLAQWLHSCEIPSLLDAVLTTVHEAFQKGLLIEKIKLRLFQEDGWICKLLY